MLTFKDVEAYLTAGLRDLGYSTKNPNVSQQAQRMPLFDPGPFSLPTLQKKTAGALVLATVGNGAGLELEQTYDQIFVTLRVLGLPRNYDAAEGLAFDLDRLMLAVNSPAYVGSTRVLSINRSGGAPQLIDYGADERYQFQTTYIARAATGL